MSGYKEMHGMPPPAYSPQASQLPAPPQGAGYGYSPAAGYAPAPPMFPQQQQSSNTNVVVVGQPSAPSPPPTRVVQPRANDYMVFTAVLFILCCIHGNILAVLLLIPALVCAFTASNHNNSGEYESAKQCGELALCCNILVIIKYVFLVIAGGVILILFLTGVLAFTHTVSSVCHDVCVEDYYGVQHCNEVCV